MDPKFLISSALTACAFVLTMFLVFVVAVVKDDIAPVAVDADMVTVSPPLQPEIEHAGKKVFEANCKACHRIHQQLVGPPLAGVMERRDSLWVVSMIRNSSKLIASGDPTAVELFQRFNRTQMTAFTTLSDEDLRKLLAYIKLESERGESRPLPSPEKAQV